MVGVNRLKPRAPINVRVKNMRALDLQTLRGVGGATSSRNGSTIVAISVLPIILCPTIDRLLLSTYSLRNIHVARNQTFLLCIFSYRDRDLHMQQPQSGSDRAKARA